MTVPGTTIDAMQEQEALRYKLDFARLSSSRGTVEQIDLFAFFKKFCLVEAEIDPIWKCVKALEISLAETMNETEFVIVMHLIVCTGRGACLATIQNFLSDLFPTLHLPQNRAKESSSNVSQGILSDVCRVYDEELTHWDQKDKCTLGSRSIKGTLNFEARTKFHQRLKVKALDDFDVDIRQNLESTLVQLAHQLESFGLPVIPKYLLSLGSIQELCDILREHVHTIRQELQAPHGASQNLQDRNDDEDALIQHLTQQLLQLQDHEQQLRRKHEAVQCRLLQEASGVSMPCLF